MCFYVFINAWSSARRLASRRACYCFCADWVLAIGLCFLYYCTLPVGDLAMAPMVAYHTITIRGVRSISEREEFPQGAEPSVFGVGVCVLVGLLTDELYYS